MVNFVRISSSTFRLLRFRIFSAPPAFFNAGVADHQTAKPGGIDVIHLVEIQDDVDLTVIGQFADLFAKAGYRLADGQPPIEVEDDDPFAFAFLNVESHTGAVSLYSNVTGCQRRRTRRDASAVTGDGLMSVGISFNPIQRGPEIRTQNSHFVQHLFRPGIISGRFDGQQLMRKVADRSLRYRDIHREPAILQTR